MSGPITPSDGSSGGDLTGRCAVVTGSGGGIGAAVARCLAEAGAAVVVNDIHVASAQATAESIVAGGGHALSVVADVSTAAGVDAVMAGAETFGPVDILVNNVGVSIPAAPLGEVAVAELERLCRLNLSSQVLCCQAVLPAMTERRWGRIVNMSSRTWLGSAGLSFYSATKGGVISFTRSLALELAGTGVTVNVIAPGTIRTPAFDRQPPERIEALLGRSPARRFGTSEDIGRAVCLFASPASAALTGQLLHVCGGRSLYGGPPPVFAEGEATSPA